MWKSIVRGTVREEFRNWWQQCLDFACERNDEGKISRVAEPADQRGTTNLQHNNESFTLLIIRKPVSSIARFPLPDGVFLPRDHVLDF